MFSLGLLLLLSLVLDKSGQNVSILSSEDRILTYLDSDSITKDILVGVYNRPMTPQFKSLLHLSLNNLLISSEVMASINPNNSVDLQQAADSIQQENEELLNLLETQQERDKFKEDYALLSTEIANAVNLKYDTEFVGGLVASADVKESIASLLSMNEIQKPLRVHSFNTLIHRFLGVLELSGLDPMSKYPGDDIDFSKKYWSNMLKMYSSSNRKFLGTDTALS